MVFMLYKFIDTYIKNFVYVLNSNALCIIFKEKKEKKKQIENDFVYNFFVKKILQCNAVLVVIQSIALFTVSLSLTLRIQHSIL